jgi:hypothetical protein
MKKKKKESKNKDFGKIGKSILLTPGIEPRQEE